MEIGLLSHIISKDQGVLREWVVRRKMEYTFLDVIVSKGQVVMDFRKDSLMRAVTEMINKGFQITEISANRDTSRTDILVTLLNIPGTITKGMTSHQSLKEVYSFDHGQPVGESGERKRRRMAECSTDGSRVFRDTADSGREDEDSGCSSKALKGYTDSNSEDELLNASLMSPTIGLEPKTRILSNIKLSTRMKKTRRRKAYRQRLAKELHAKRCAEVTGLVAGLDLRNFERKEPSNGADDVTARGEADLKSEETEVQIHKPKIVFCQASGSNVGKSNQKTDWDKLECNVPYSSGDDKAFRDDLKNWDRHVGKSSGLSGLDFEAPLPITTCAKGVCQSNAETSNPPKAGNENVVSSTVSKLAEDFDDIDLGKEVNDFYDISPGEEARLLLGIEADNLPDMDVKELDEALAGMIYNMDVEFLKSLDKNI